MDFATDPATQIAAGGGREDQICWDIGSAVLSGVLLEVSAYPKPGLVAPRSMGAHRDMDLQTFMLSSAAIAPCLFACARAGFRHIDSPESLLPQIREIGRAYDARLLAATHGVNTQRGMLFSAGLIAAAAGLMARDGLPRIPENLFAAVARIARGLCERELVQRSGTARTAGEILYRDHGARGIRGEVEAGFPTVAAHGLPALRTALAEGHGLNRCLVHGLIALAAHAEDTTVLWRSGPEGLAFVQREAVRIQSLGGALTPAGMVEIERLNVACIDRNISPGGSADLLAVTVAVHLLENGRFPESCMISSHCEDQHE